MGGPKLEGDIYETLWIGAELWNCGKTQLVSFDWSNHTDAIDKKKDGSVL